MENTDQTQSQGSSASLLLTRQLELIANHINQYEALLKLDADNLTYSALLLTARRDLDIMLHVKQLYIEVTKLEQRIQELSRSARG